MKLTCFIKFKKRLEN